jgi:hypothetical protein
MSFTRGEVRRKPEPWNGHRTVRSQVSGVRSWGSCVEPERLYSLAGRREVTSAKASAPVSCPFLHRTPLFPEAFTAPWDGYSTPVCCSCQVFIPIYCISKQLKAQRLDVEPCFPHSWSQVVFPRFESRQGWAAIFMRWLGADR